MSEQGQRPPAEFGDSEEQIQWIADACHFLALRPDVSEEELRGTDAAVSPEEPVSNSFRLDGEKITITAAEQPDAGSPVSKVITAGSPDLDKAGRWFVKRTDYEVDFPPNGRPELTLMTRQVDSYELQGLILPEFYEEIREDYEKQRDEEGDDAEGFDTYLAKITIAPVVAFAVLKSMRQVRQHRRLSDYDDMSENKIRDRLLHEIEETAMSMFDNPDGESKQAIRRAIRQLLQKTAEEEGVDVVGPEEAGDDERDVLVGKLKRLLSDPDAHQISDSSSTDPDS